ncbi:MAG TPA: ADOP family duplicated permease, partial [Gemmatimonadales bacterium]|nr:ADOP family duplicated permease [Gemmatimonadales bacterium]
MLLDLRLALRRLRLAPGFTALAVLMLGLGIGATTTVFTLLNTVFLRPPAAVRAPDQLVAIYTSDYSGPRFGNTSFPDLEAFRAGTAGTLETAGYTIAPLSVSTGAERFRTAGELVTRNYFSVLGVAPALGRLFGGDEQPTAAVISHALWQGRYGGAADVIGRTIRVGGQGFTVVGVAPPGFTGSVRGVGADVWLALEAARLFQPGSDPLANRGHRDLFLLGRLAPGATTDDVAARLGVVADRLHDAYPDSWTDVTGAARVVTVVPERDARLFPSIRGPVSAFLGVLMGVAMLVLLVCCANLANLLLARGTARRREMAVRLALGGARARLVRQLLVEGLVLALLGGGLGVAAAAWSVALLRRFQPPVPVPVALDLRVDHRILAFALAATVLVTLVSALVPALRATRLDAGDGLRADASTPAATGRHIGLRDVLVVLQVAVSLVVLSAAGLFLASLRQATGIDPGFSTSGVALMPVALEVQGYEEARARAFYDELLRRARALPGVEAASLAERVPLGLGTLRRGLEVEGYTRAPGEEMEFGVNTVSADYFTTMGIPLARGRAFDARDGADAVPVAIVNESFARRFWPGGDAVGRRIVVGGVRREIVGIARDAKYVSLGEEPQPHYYLPWAQAFQGDMVLQVRTSGDARALLPSLAALARGLDADLPVEPITMDQHLGLALLPQRL